jgi:hypothetical protein
MNAEALSGEDESSATACGREPSLDLMPATLNVDYWQVLNLSLYYSLSRRILLQLATILSIYHTTSQRCQ